MSECAPCAYTVEHGWWGDALPKGHTHCRDCHHTFRANNTIGHCSGCHHTFSGSKAFDMHQRTVPDREYDAPVSPCLDPASVRDKHEREALLAGDDGVWHQTGGYYGTGGPNTKD